MTIEIFFEINGPVSEQIQVAVTIHKFLSALNNSGDIAQLESNIQSEITGIQAGEQA